jgi:nitroimidazol reductase NimA-like FMN-containing flavoprotein (pyridoxamine 5'-phosphate oxidase superfamily)
MTDGRRLQSITRSESLRLLGDVSMGRVVFTHRALPAVRPVSHIVEGEQIIIRVDRESALARAISANAHDVVAFEADEIDPTDHLGWSVIVIGRAHVLRDGEGAARYRQALQPWVAGTFDDIIMIEAEMVDGFRLTMDPGPDGEGQRPRGADLGTQAAAAPDVATGDGPQHPGQPGALPG